MGERDIQRGARSEDTYLLETLDKVRANDGSEVDPTLDGLCLKLAERDRHANAMSLAELKKLIVSQWTSIAHRRITSSVSLVVVERICRETAWWIALLKRIWCSWLGIR